MSNLQEERSAETRRRILEAAALTLFECGYAGTTIAEVAERAGVSRGAEMHHFPKKETLVIAALEYIFDQRIAESQQIGKRLGRVSDRLDYIVDSLWSVYKGPAFHAWIELVVASRTDPTLREAVAKISQGFTEASMGIWQELLGPDSYDPERLRILDRVTNGQLEAIALSRILYPPSDEDNPELLEMVDWVKKIGHFLLLYKDSSPAAEIAS